MTFVQTFPIDIVEKIKTEPTPFVVYMDTDSVFLDIQKLVPKVDNVEEITKSIYDISDQLEKYINKTVIDEFCSLHNINSKDSKLSFKQEVISRKALFFGKKKNYVLEIVDKERHPLDKPELDIKGLETRRSDYSKLSKEIIFKILDLIFKENKDLPALMEFLKTERERVMELVKVGHNTTGRPVSYAKNTYDKTIPGHIRGMNNWNNLFYEYFRMGTKGLMYYIKGIDSTKVDKKFLVKYERFLKENPDGLSQIVVPDKEDQLPNFLIVDEEKMIDLVFDARVLRLMTPFGVTEINWVMKNSSVLPW
jgi:DNA polymerase elongation subunit (family B)